MKVAKEFRFEAGHRLYKYPGNCRNIHGHSYVATIEMELTGDHLNEYGFVKDFGDFKAVKEWIDEKWDHAFLANEADTTVIEFLRRPEENQRLFICPTNPTAEWMAMHLYQVACNLLNEFNCKVCSVSIKETATSNAIYTAPCSCHK